MSPKNTRFVTRSGRPHSNHHLGTPRAAGKSFKLSDHCQGADMLPTWTLSMPLLLYEMKLLMPEQVSRTRLSANNIDCDHDTAARCFTFENTLCETPAHATKVNSNKVSKQTNNACVRGLSLCPKDDALDPTFGQCPLHNSFL